VQEAFQKQNQVNDNFNHRIGALEVTTASIDNKMDLLLERYDWASPRKAQKTTKNMDYKLGRLSDHLVQMQAEEQQTKSLRY